VRAALQNPEQAIHRNQYRDGIADPTQVLKSLRILSMAACLHAGTRKPDLRNAHKRVNA